MFLANCDASMRKSVFMVFCILAGVTIAWYYQFAFEVPRERQGEMFGLVGMLVVFALVLCRAAIATLGGWHRQNRSDDSDA